MSRAQKRQKIEHEQSDGEDDASFASFNDDDDELDASDSEELDDASERGAVKKEVVRTVNGHFENATKATSTRSDTLQRSGSTTCVGRNAFELRVDQMLQQIRPKHTATEVEAEEVLLLVKETIESTPARGPLSVVEARQQLRKNKIVIPFPAPAPALDSNLKFEYSKPTSINVVGSYPIKTADRTRKFLYIDMVVHMPSTLFQDKDYLDLRYFYKRAFYLACLAADLRKTHSDSFDMRFQQHHDDPLRPVITIRPQRVNDQVKPSRNWQINILPAIAEDVFPATKLAPDRSCIRKGRTEQTPTPMYNSSLRADMLISPYLKLLHKASTSCSAYKDACALGSTWLKQRGFRATPRQGGVASFEWSALVALLLLAGDASSRATISDRLDKTQIFRSALQVLANKDVVKYPLILGTGHELGNISSDVPVIWDAVRGHNILHKCPIWAFRRLQDEAKMTLSMLGNGQFDSFEAAFIMRQDDPLLIYDSVASVHLDMAKAAPSMYEDDTVFDKLYTVLRKGLTNRVRDIYISAQRSKPWAFDHGSAQAQLGDTIILGMSTDPAYVDRSVDHGPGVDDKEASAAFRRFWGAKSELRRFKDGSISEALVWDTVAGSPPVLEQVIRYLLQLHLKISKNDRVLFGSATQAHLTSSMSQQDSQAALEAFRALENDIRSLEGLPLPIRQIVLATRPVYRQLNVSTDVVMQFESSGRWPDDLAAIQRTKIAFLLMVSELLTASQKPLASRVGLENSRYDILNQAYLEVAYNKGSAYRVRLFHDREQTLLERRLKDRTLGSVSAEVSATALATYKRQYLRRPGHAQAMMQLCGRHGALAGTVEVLHKWLASHLLANHFDQELVELIAARVFVQPWPFSVPSSVHTAFLRCLAWLARWDWRYEPLLVDMSSVKELKGEAAASVHTRFEAWRKLDPTYSKVAVFAASNVDPDGTTFTTGKPAKVVVSRMITLAKAALQEVQTKGLQLDTGTLFTSPLTDFSFVLHIDPAAAKHGKKRKNVVYKNLELDAVMDSTGVGLDTTRDLLGDLQDVFGSAVLFFSGLPHRPTIGGVWLPQTAERAWKVNLTYSTVPVNAKDSDATAACVNKRAMLAEIARLGGDLIQRIDTHDMS